MPFRTETYDVNEELARLRDRREEVAAAAVEAAPNSDERARRVDEGATLDAQINGLQWVRAEYGGDTAIEVGGLNKGEQARVYDRADADAETVVGAGETGTQGAKSVYRCAAGLVDAPFLPAEATDFEARVQVVREDLPVELCAWLERRVTDLTTVGEGNSETFAELLAAKETQSGRD